MPAPRSILAEDVPSEETDVSENESSSSDNEIHMRRSSCCEIEQILQELKETGKGLRNNNRIRILLHNNAMIECVHVANKDKKASNDPQTGLLCRLRLSPSSVDWPVDKIDFFSRS